VFTYSPHTLLEERFTRFLRAYHEVFPLSAAEVRFLPLAYQFFILNYVVREGSKFFQAPLSDEFRRDAVARYLPQVSSLDVTPILELLGLSS
jgi:Ser/Thr protein kinase RdoA (MazF antagonist)